MKIVKICPKSPRFTVPFPRIIARLNSDHSDLDTIFPIFRIFSREDVDSVSMKHISAF